jgi:hypothetical protein
MSRPGTAVAKRVGAQLEISVELQVGRFEVSRSFERLPGSDYGLLIPYPVLDLEALKEKFRVRMRGSGVPVSIK